MKITNKIKFAAITLLLLAGSATQALADDWTGGFYFSGCYDLKSHLTANLNDFRGTDAERAARGISASWGASEYTSGGDLGEKGAHAFKHTGTTRAYTRCITIGNFWLTKNIPSYSKLVRKVTFNLYLAGTRHHHGCGLYFFGDNDGLARNAVLDATYLQDYTDDYAGKSYLIYKYGSEDRTGTSEKRSADYSWDYDNSNNPNDKNWTKVIAFLHASGREQKDYDGLEWASWAENLKKETWYYYKHITFDANGGTGAAMAQQTIENSGNLTTNAYTRPGYTFIGWNTQADGKGTAYTNGQAITATLQDKGPVTLYAQWTLDLTISELGSATIFYDKNLVVPAGVEVYGFTYTDGILVQGAKISEGAILPAYNGYLVKTSKAGTYHFAITTSAATVPGTDVTGTTTEINTPTGAYVWGKPEGYNCGWYKYTGETIPACKAYFVTGYITDSNNGGINDMNINTDKDF